MVRRTGRRAVPKPVQPPQQGRVMQVDPIKLMLKPPGAKHWRLQCDELLSSFAFKFNLRCYSKLRPAAMWPMQAAATLVGWCRLTVSKPAKARMVSALETEICGTAFKRWFQRLNLKHEKPLSNVAFNFNLRRYTLEASPGNTNADDAWVAGKALMVTATLALPSAIFQLTPIVPPRTADTALSRDLLARQQQLGQRGRESQCETSQPP
jgi:hypothetical protein